MALPFFRHCHKINYRMKMKKVYPSDPASIIHARNERSASSYAYLIVLFAFIIMVGQWGIFHSFGVFFKPMVSEFGWTRALTSGAFSIASFLSGLVAVYMGWLNDKVGPRIVMTFCGVLLGLGCLLMSQIQSLWHFYIFYGVIFGIAMGGGFIPPVSTVTRWFNKSRGFMIGIVASGSGVGALVGPQISNALVMHYGWREAYFITGIAALILLIAAAQIMKNKPGQSDQSSGYRIRVFSRPGADDHHSISIMTVVGLIQFWLLSITGLCYGYTLFSITVHSVPNAIDMGFSPKVAAGLLSTFGGLNVVGKLFFGKILDKINSKKTMLVGFSMLIVTFVGLYFSQSAWALYVSVGSFGFFVSACTVSHSPITAVLFGLRSHGLMLGIYGISVTIGGALGPIVTGAIFDQTASYDIAFAVCILVSVMGMAATVGIRHMRIELKGQ